MNEGGSLKLSGNFQNDLLPLDSMEGAEQQLIQVLGKGWSHAPPNADYDCESSDRRQVIEVRSSRGVRDLYAALMRLALVVDEHRTCLVRAAYRYLDKHRRYLDYPWALERELPTPAPQVPVALPLLSEPRTTTVADHTPWLVGD